MQRDVSDLLRRLLTAAVVLLIVKVTFSVVAGYQSYVPPDFTSDFLLGRDAYFFGPYRWAFYAHLVAGPFSLLAGTLLVSDTLRCKLPSWHRRLGQTQMAVVLLVLAPSGLWMAPYAATGSVAALGLALLAISTATCAALGWRAAAAQRFMEHRRWMWRTYLLLCSAVVIRLMGGLASVLHWNADWYYPLSVWTSWVAPLAVFEGLAVLALRTADKRRRRHRFNGDRAIFEFRLLGDAANGADGKVIGGVAIIPEIAPMEGNKGHARA